MGLLPLALVGEPVAVATEEVTPGAIELANPPAAREAVYDPWTDEPWTHAAEVAWCPDDGDGLLDVLPFLAVAPVAIGQYQPLLRRTHADGRPRRAGARPLPAAKPSRLQATLPMQRGDVEAAAPVRGRSPAVLSRAQATHQSAPDFPKSFGKSTRHGWSDALSRTEPGTLMPGPARALKSAFPGLAQREPSEAAATFTSTRKPVARQALAWRRCC
jgi:hypothetical protein